MSPVSPLELLPEPDSAPGPAPGHAPSPRRTARAAAMLSLALLLAGCGTGPVTTAHSPDGAEVLAHSEEGGSGQAGEGEGAEREGAEGEGAEEPAEEEPAAEEPAEQPVAGGVDQAFLRALREEHVQTLLLAEGQIADGTDAAATELARRVVEQQSAQIAEIDRLLAG